MMTGKETDDAGTMGSQPTDGFSRQARDRVRRHPPAGLENGKAFHREYAEHFIKQRGATRKQIDYTFP